MQIEYQLETRPRPFPHIKAEQGILPLGMGSKKSVHDLGRSWSDCQGLPQQIKPYNRYPHLEGLVRFYTGSLAVSPYIVHELPLAWDTYLCGLPHHGFDSPYS